MAVEISILELGVRTNILINTQGETTMRVLDAICKWWLNRKKSTSTALVPVHIPNGRWEQVRLAGSEIVRSYRYTCRCGQTQPLTIAEANDGKDRACGCTKKFNLLRDIGALNCNVSEAQSALATLPVHALAVQQRRPAVQVVDYDTAGEVIWTGEKQSSGVQWR
jgi:hypothetical protein